MAWGEVARMRVYLAGPMTGHAELNFPAFLAAAEALRAAGHVVHSPAEEELAAGFHPDAAQRVAPKSHAEYMADDLPNVCRAEAVVVLPGWVDSRGTRIEVGVARALGLPVLAYPDLEPVEDAPALTVAGDGTGEVLPEVAGDGRERVAEPATGGEKERRRARFDLLPWDALWQVAEVYGHGAGKYAPHNWRRGYAWSLSLGAAGRHLAKLAAGEDTDAESGQPHAAHLAFHALALLVFAREHPELDDRAACSAPPWTVG